MTAPTNSSPWGRLFERAASQGGYFTTRQAAAIGCSAQLLSHYLHAGRLRRVRHGIYRLVQLPDGNHDDLMIVWLWSHRAGVFSHETALSLHELSDLMPSQIHLSLPTAASQRHRKAPDQVVIHYADIGTTDRSWIANVPATTPKRTLVDCAMAGLQPEFLRQAVEQALKRGLVARADVVEVDLALREFGGLHA